MKREDITRHIALLECLGDVKAAIEDVETTEFDAGEDGLFAIEGKSNSDGRAVSFVHGLPPEVLLAGLRAMDAALTEAVKALAAQEVAA
jgi:hypothetical protein